MKRVLSAKVVLFGSSSQGEEEAQVMPQTRFLRHGDCSSAFFTILF